MAQTFLRILAASILATSALPAAAATLTLRDTNSSFVGAQAAADDAPNPIFLPDESNGTFEERTTAFASQEIPLASATASVDALDGTLRGRSSGSSSDAGGVRGAANTGSRLVYHFDVSGAGPATLPAGWLEFGFDGVLALNQPFGGSSSIGTQVQVGTYSDTFGIFLDNNRAGGFPETSFNGESALTSLAFEENGNRVRFSALFTAPSLTISPGDELIIRLRLSTSGSNALADSFSTALLAINLPDTVSLDTQALGADAPAWLGRTIEAPTPVPAPPALLLGLSGLALMFGIARRRRTH